MDQSIYLRFFIYLLEAELIILSQSGPTIRNQRLTHTALTPQRNHKSVPICQTRLSHIMMHRSTQGHKQTILCLINTSWPVAWEVTWQCTGKERYFSICPSVQKRSMYMYTENRKTRHSLNSNQRDVLI